MSYFTEVVAQSEEGFRALGIDVHDFESLEDLVDSLQDLASDEISAVAVIEHEDSWFALIRVIGDVTKVFISDLDLAAESPFAELFADYLESRPDQYDVDSEELEVEEVEESDSEDEEEGEDEDAVQMFEPEEPGQWGGDADIFADAGVTEEDLLEQVGRFEADPARIVAHIAEHVGFGDELEAAR